MTMFPRRAAIVGLALVAVGIAGMVHAAEGDTAGTGLPPDVLGAPAGPPPGGLPTLPGAPPSFPSVSPLPAPTGPPPGTGDTGGLTTMLPTLRATDSGSTEGLPSLAAVDEGTTNGESTTPTAAVISGGLTTNYAFLFRETDDAEDAVVRDKYTQEEAEKIAAAEVTRLAEGFQTAGGGPQGQQGQDPLAGGAWDFYFQQMELYNRYVRETVLVGSSRLEDITEPTYDAPNYLQERSDLKSAFEQEAIILGNEEYNENLDFYDRLQTREDRRRAYYEWLSAQKRIVDETAARWVRNVNGANWGATDQPTNLDDWYYKKNFTAEGGVNVELDGHRFVTSRDPLKQVPPDTLNVQTTNLTPYDILNTNGRLKLSGEERMKMGLRAAPDEAAAGTIQILE